MRLSKSNFLLCKNLSLIQKKSYVNLHRSFSQIDKKCFLKMLYHNKIRIHLTSKTGFHMSHQLFAKSFQESENELAHSVMENLLAYTKTIVKPPLSVDAHDYVNCPKEIEEFAKVTINSISENVSLQDYRFTPMISRIVHIIPQMSDDCIIKCLYLLCCWPPTPKTWTPNFKALWNSLDEECVTRLQYWDNNKKLLVADYWFCLRLSRITLYNKSMIESFLQNLSDVTDAELVQIMFYINLQRDIPPNHLKALEIRLLSTAKKISMKELGIICSGFFKTKNKAENFSFCKVIIDRLIKEIDNTEEATITALLKFLKKSMYLSYTEYYIPLLHRCTSYVQNWKVTTCIHSGLLASECHVYHPLLLNSIIKKVARDIKNARLKDCMKLLQCVSHFNHLPDQEFNDKLFSEIKKESRQEEINNYPRDLIYICLYYAYMGFYNYELITMVLNSEFSKRCITLFPETNVAFAEVDCCVEIECKDYMGSRMDKKFLKLLSQRRGNIALTPEKSNATMRITNEIILSLTGIFGSDENIKLKHILPHIFSPDIIVQLSGNSKLPIKCENEIFIPPEKEVWACLVIGAPFSFAYRSKYITGVVAMKLRQLEKLGYKTIFIPYYELRRDSVKLAQYLKQKLKNVVKHNNTKLSLTMK